MVADCFLSLPIVEQIFEWENHVGHVFLCHEIVAKLWHACGEVSPVSGIVSKISCVAWPA